MGGGNAIVDSGLTMHCGHLDSRPSTGFRGVAIAAAADNTDVAEMAVAGAAV